MFSFEDAFFEKFILLFARLGFWVGDEGPKQRWRIAALVLLGTVLLVALLPGIALIEEENDIGKLYTHLNDRLSGEKSTFERYFGGLTRLEATIHTSDTGNTASKKTLDSIIFTLAPVLKHDETDMCPTLDGVRTTLPDECASEPWRSQSPYCACNVLAASPNEVFVTWPAKDENGADVLANITQRDLCETPETPNALKPSKELTLYATEDKLYSDAQYNAIQSQTASALASNNGLASDPVFIASLNGAVAACEQAFQASEQGRDAALLKSDLVSAGISCAGTAVAAAFGPAYSLAANSNFSIAGLRTMWGTFITQAATTQAQLEGAYASAANGDNLEEMAAQTVAMSNATVRAAAGVVAQSVLTAVSARQFNFLREGRILSYGYQAVADCVTSYVSENDVLGQAFQATLQQAAAASLGGGQLGTINAVYSLSLAGYPAAGASAMREAIAQSPTASVEARVVYLSATEAVFDVVTSSIASARNLTFNAAALSAGRSAAIAAFASAGGDTAVFENATVQSDIASAFVNSGGNPSTANNATDVILTALGSEIALSLELLPTVAAFIEASAQAGAILSLANLATVNNTMRPLPRQWGVDRFPCNRVLPTDVFREGGFDYPYALIQAQVVAPLVFAFLTQDAFAIARADAQCVERNPVDEVKQGLYMQTLTEALGDPTTYQADNFVAFDAAEAAFRSALAGGATQTAAAGAAVQAFFANGGEYRTAGAPQSASVPTMAVQAALATAIGTAASAESSIAAGMLDTAQTFFGIGYYYRPSYRPLTDAQIVDLMGSAVRDTQDVNVSSRACILHNTELDGSGRVVPACFLTFSGTKNPPQLVTGKLDYGNDGVLDKIGSMRTVLSNFNENHPTFADKISVRLNRNLGSLEREDLLRAWEAAMISHYNKFYQGRSGSGYGDGETYATEFLVMNAERSSSDTLDEVAEIDPAFLVGAAVVLLVYAGATMFNASSLVHSHMGLIVWGVVCILLSTAAAIGFSGYVNIKSSPITTNVVPFLSIGVGVDDLFVIMGAYSQEMAIGGGVSSILAKTLGLSGPSVLFTSTVNFVAFLIASATPIAVVRQFCQQMAVSVIANWLILHTLFLGFLVLDAMRTKAGKTDMGFPACTTQCRDDRDRHRAAVDVAQTKKNSGPVDRFCSTSYPQWLLSNPVRALVMIFFTAWLAVSCWSGFTQLETGLRLSDVSNIGSYQKIFATTLEDDFLMYSGVLITTSNDFPGAQATMLQTLTELQKSEWVSAVPPIQDLYWLTNLLENEGTDQPLPESEFYDRLAAYLGGLGVTYAQDLFCIDVTTGSRVSCLEMYNSLSRTRNANVELAATRGSYYLQDLAENSNFLDAIESTRARVDRANKLYTGSGAYHSFAISYVHLFWDQYLHIVYDALFIVGMCLLGVALTTFIFTFNIRIALILCVIIFAVVIELLGVIPIWDVKLNAFSLVNLALAVGMAVELSAHLAHEFVVETGDSRKERARAALSFMGTPIGNGVLSSILVTLFILGSGAIFIQEVFFGMFFATIVIAGLNGLVLLPVVLSLFGPKAVPLHLDEEEGTGHQRSALSRLVDSKMVRRQAGPSSDDTSKPGAPQKGRISSAGTNMIDLDTVSNATSPGSSDAPNSPASNGAGKYNVSTV